MYFNAKSDRYWYEIHGKNGPWLVLLHGFTGRSTTWKPLLHMLTERFRVLTVDLPGHGHTRTSLKTMQSCARDLDALFDYLQLNLFHLLGYSLGGRTALFYTITYPDHVQRLVLESASPGLQSEAERQKRKERDNQMAITIEKGGMQTFVDIWENIPLFQSQKQLASSVQLSIRQERMSQSPAGLANSLRGMGTGMQPSLWETLKNVSCPVLLLTGDLDEKFTAINQVMKNRFPAANLEVIPQSGHALHVEVPVKFGKIINDFIFRNTI